MYYYVLYHLNSFKLLNFTSPTSSSLLIHKQVVLDVGREFGQCRHCSYEPTIANDPLAGISWLRISKKGRMWMKSQSSQPTTIFALAGSMFTNRVIVMRELRIFPSCSNGLVDFQATMHAVGNTIRIDRKHCNLPTSSFIHPQRQVWRINIGCPWCIQGGPSKGSWISDLPHTLWPFIKQESRCPIISLPLLVYRSVSQNLISFLEEDFIKFDGISCFCQLFLGRPVRLGTALHSRLSDEAFLSTSISVNWSNNQLRAVEGYMNRESKHRHANLQGPQHKQKQVSFCF